MSFAPLLLSLPAVVLAASCAIEGFTVGSAPGAGGSSSATSTTASGTGGGAGAGGTEDDGGICGHATYPNPPGATSLGTESFIVALRSIDLGENSPTPPGLDLDGKCSCCCEGEQSTCLEPKTNCDFPLGVDNAAAGLFKLVSGTLANFSSSFFSSGSEAGNWSVILRVQGYNGEADDDQVELDWYMSSGTQSIDGTRVAAVWDGKDRWGISPESVQSADGGAPDQTMPVDAPGNEPRFVDTKAYVTAGKLVASFPDADVRIAGKTNSILLRLTGGFLVANIEKEPAAADAYTLSDGLVVAKWKTADLFQALSSYRTDTGEPFCTDDFAYKIGKTTLCKAVDVFSGTSTPTTPCDAFSLGLAFSAFPATFGLFTAFPADLPGCPVETDPAFDTCDTP